MAQQAQDNFVAEIDGVPLAVMKGEVYPDKHPLVKLDAGRGLLFKPLDIDAGEAPAGKQATAPKSRAAAKGGA